MIVQVLLALAIIGLVLLQQGKGADMGAAFGAGASGTVFGARGTGSFFSRATAVLAALFFMNSILLSSPLVLGERHPTESVTDSVVTEPGSDVPPSDDVADTPASDLPDVDSEATAAPPADDLPEATEQQDTPAPAAEDTPDAAATTEAAGDAAASAETPAADAAESESGKSAGQ
jgi:preprotein translocase subunit SecG